MTAPVAACLAALPAGWGLVALALLRVPAARSPPPDRPHRPGTLGLEWQIATALERAAPPRPLVVDGAWVSGGLAAEPGAVMLDLHLRGWPAADLAPGGAVAVIVSAERAAMARIHYGGPRVFPGDRHFLVVGDPAGLEAALCAESPRLGGAWDALAVLHPDLDAAAVGAWWRGCD
jgi:hypothetical protein